MPLDQKNLEVIPWYARAVAMLTGVSYTRAFPVIAGQRTGGKDAAGNTINLGAKPPEAIFLNLVPDHKLIDLYERTRFDYIFGNSDAAVSPQERLEDGTMVYWAAIPISERATFSFRFDQPVIVPLSHTYVSTNDRDEKIDSRWLCLRRVGREDGTIFLSSVDQSQIWVRSRKRDGSIKEESIPVKYIIGQIYDRYNIQDPSFVRTIKSLPLM